jgi:hypothetical protein
MTVTVSWVSVLCVKTYINITSWHNAKSTFFFNVCQYSNGKEDRQKVYWYILAYRLKEAMYPYLCVFMQNAHSNSDTVPLFLLRSLWQYIEGGSKLIYGMVGSFCSQTVMGPPGKCGTLVGHIVLGGWLYIVRCFSTPLCTMSVTKRLMYSKCFFYFHIRNY